MDVSEFVKSDTIVEYAKYEDGKIIIKFTNCDIITIDVEELLDENEFKNGLQVNGGQVSVLIDGESDEYLSVSENGVKVAGVKADIEAEEARATSAETTLDEKIDNETTRATSEEERIEGKLDDEVSRATTKESEIETELNQEVTRAKAAEADLRRRNDMLNDELDAEEAIRDAGDVALGRRIDQEISDRISDVDAEETRAKEAEAELQAAI